MSMVEKVKQHLFKLGGEPKRSLGQNFLVSEHVIEKILKQVAEFKPEHIVEVGPGLGALTEGLLAMTPHLDVIELDSAFAGYWREKGLRVTEQDALKVDWDSLIQGKKVLFVSNLPYQISSSIVIERCLGQNSIYAMILMFQKEVAQRLMALPKTSQYGMLSVVAQANWSIRTLLEAGTKDFYPSPKIASRVLVFERKPAQFNQRMLLKVAKAAFAQRRKMLTKNLMALNSSVDWDKVFMEKGWNVKARAEELSPADYIQLTEFLGEQSK